MVRSGGSGGLSFAQKPCEVSVQIGRIFCPQLIFNSYILWPIVINN